MTRCKAFYDKWEKDPNFCDKSISTVQRIDHYLDLVHEIEAEGADIGAIYRKFPEAAAREVLKAGDEKREEIIQNTASMIKRGEKVSPADIRTWSGVESPPIGTKRSPDNEVKEKVSIVQDEDGYVEKRPIEPVDTTAKYTLAAQQKAKEAEVDANGFFVTTPAKSQAQIRKENMALLEEACDLMLSRMPSARYVTIIELAMSEFPGEFPTKSQVISAALDLFNARKK